MVSNILSDLVFCEEVSVIVLTQNIPDSSLLVIPDELQKKIVLVSNDSPKGFAANHNAAFKCCNTPYFCVVNPDVRLKFNPFPKLLSALIKAKAAISAPLIVNSQGQIEDSIRFFPTPVSLLKKVLCISKGTYELKRCGKVLYPEWVGGMFMLFDSASFKFIDGFDERFFLYYEDVDICARLWKKKMIVVVSPNVEVIHDAQRSSHKSFKFLCWHFTSVLRFFIKHLGRLPVVKL